MSCIILRDENRNEINMQMLGLTGLNLIVPSPKFNRKYESIDGHPGKILIEQSLDAREIKAEFYYEPTETNRLIETRDKLFELFSKDFFYIADKKNPTKQWRVIADSWTPDDFSEDLSTFEVPLTVIDGVSESVNLLKKKFTTPKFIFKNEGNVPIDPRVRSETMIEFKGASTNLIIVNTTTNERWSYTGSTGAWDTILLKGIQSFKNGASIFGETNKKLLTMAAGNNEFTISGASSAVELTISTRFYFL